MSKDHGIALLPQVLDALQLIAIRRGGLGGSKHVVGGEEGG